MYITASGLPKLCLKMRGKFPSSPAATMSKFFTSVYLQTPCHQNLSGMVGLLGSGWSYLDHWWLPMPRSEDLGEKEAVIAYKLFN